ncbi:pentapeptide repeat-containing protein [Methyloglobulus sp.]|uniref:pentapeptide repeat-containing protein n=1 Tax=Methyloglobulus sp. TaxID=2518622 RepID=UPI00398903AB
MNNSPPADDELDPPYRDVFKDPQNGTPDNITQAGCLALARLGKEAWNAWRKDFPAWGSIADPWENTADFSGFDFRDKWTNFDDFEFDHGARFDGAQFGYNAFFTYTQFGDQTSFIGAQFGDDVNFEGAHFGYNARFEGARFGNRTSFYGAQFGDVTSFIGAQFGALASFEGAQFGDDAHFDGAQFNDGARFDGVQFNDRASFAGFNWASLADLYRKCPGGLEAAKAWAEARGLSSETFKSISFKGADFAGQVDFSGRAFEGPTSFGRLNYPIKIKRRSPDGNIVEKVLPKGHPVVFGQAPLFHNCKLHQDSTFYGAEFPNPSTDPTKNDTAARAYRTLKLAFAQQQATHEEQRFFRLEMDEEAARASRSQRWLFVVYKWVSDYGFSLSRPTFWWLVFMLLFSLIYSLLAGFTLCMPCQADCHIRYDLLQFTLLQALPLPGLDKWSDSLRQGLFPKEGWGSVWIIVAVMIHKAISLLAVFLFGLALRNLFKMK